jgi:hypothetical protein
VAGLELLRAKSRNRHADMLFFAAGIGKPEIDVFHAFLLDRLEYFFWSHDFILSRNLSLFVGCLYGVRGKGRDKPHILPEISIAPQIKKALDLNFKVEDFRSP